MTSRERSGCSKLIYSVSVETEHVSRTDLGNKKTVGFFHPNPLLVLPVPVLLRTALFGPSSKNGAKGDQTEQYFKP